MFASVNSLTWSQIVTTHNKKKTTKDERAFLLMFPTTSKEPVAICSLGEQLTHLKTRRQSIQQKNENETEPDQSTYHPKSVFLFFFCPLPFTIRSNLKCLASRAIDFVPISRSSLSNDLLSCWESPKWLKVNLLLYPPTIDRNRVDNCSSFFAVSKYLYFDVLSFLLSVSLSLYFDRKYEFDNKMDDTKRKTLL